jgi:hypothetical protein
MVRTKTRADDKQANSVAIRALADAHRRLTPPRIGWRTPEPAQVTTPLKNCSGGIFQNLQRICVAARHAQPDKVRRDFDFSQK